MSCGVIVTAVSYTHLFHKCVGDTGGKVAFSCPHATPKQVADIFSLHGFPALHIKAGGFSLWVSAVVMLKCPVLHSGVGKAPAFQVLHFFKVLLSAFGGLLLFTGCSLAVSYTHLDVYKRQDIRKVQKNELLHIGFVHSSTPRSLVLTLTFSLCCALLLAFS